MAGNIIIVGNSEFAEIASEYFKKDYGYETVAFAVDKEFIREDSLLGHPVVASDTLSDMYPPDKIDVERKIFRTRSTDWLLTHTGEKLSDLSVIFRNIR